MNVNNKPYTTIWTEYDSSNISKIKIIDQTKLPFEFNILDLNTLDDAYFAIKNMNVRGAPLIGVTAAYGMYLAALNSSDGSFEKDMKYISKYLKSSRPTAVNLEWAVDEQIKYIDYTKSLKENISQLYTMAEFIRNEDIHNCALIGEHGFKLIKEIYDEKQDTVNILTHCNAGWLACVDYGTATSPIYTAFNSGIPVHVWVDETRPRNQGSKLTAWELGQHGVAHTIIADNTGGHLMQHGLVDMVIVGCDRMTRRGDFANKIGTYLKALAAKDNDIPFYVALPKSSIDLHIKNGIKEIPIEERNCDEVKYIDGMCDDGKMRSVLIAPESSNALNYSFDVTPKRLVTGIITEEGICSPGKKKISKLFGKDVNKYD